MTVNQGQTMNIVHRINDLAVESTQTFLEGAHLAQRQGASFVQSWLNTVEANQSASRELATRLMKQSQEAGALWQELVQEAFRVNTEAFSQATRSTVNEVTENLNRVNGQVNATVQRATAASQ